MLTNNNLHFNSASIRLNGVSKHYGGRDALLGINLSIPENGACFVTGPSGAGKSTLLRVMALLEKPSQGDLWIKDKHIADLTTSAQQRLRVDMGFVFQAPHLLYDRNVAENVALPLFIRGYAYTEIERRTNNVLKSVGLLDRAKESPSTFSAGEQERLGIARALVAKPSMLFADEPTGNLDPKLSQEVMSLLCAMPLRGATVVIATHDISLLEQFPHIPIVELDRGRITRDGTTERSKSESPSSQVDTDVIG